VSSRPTQLRCKGMFMCGYRCTRSADSCSGGRHLHKPLDVEAECEHKSYSTSPQVFFCENITAYRCDKCLRLWAQRGEVVVECDFRASSAHMYHEFYDNLLAKLRQAEAFEGGVFANLRAMVRLAQ
jgi:hypothetical protein